MTQSETPGGAKSGPRREGQPIPDPNAALEDLIFSARGLAAALNETDVFDQHNISLEEWAILRVLIGRNEVPLKEVARSAGVSRARMRGLISALQMKGMVKTAKTTSGGKEARTVSATERAAALRPTISRYLQELVGAGGDKHGRIFWRAANTLNRLQRALRRQPKPGNRAVGKGQDLDDDD
jgi:DNA-binding MarR family transcriptional regulator